MKEIVQVLNLNERGNFHRVPKIAFFQLRDSGTSFELGIKSMCGCVS
jgi:hypothetical protein